MRVWTNIFFSSFSVFLSKNFGGFCDFGAVASRKLRKIMVIFARKMPPENSRKFPGNFPGFFFSGKMSPKSPQKNRGKWGFPGCNDLWTGENFRKISGKFPEKKIPEFPKFPKKKTVSEIFFVTPKKNVFFLCFRAVAEGYRKYSRGKFPRKIPEKTVIFRNFQKGCHPLFRTGNLKKRGRKNPKKPRKNTG